MSSRERPRPQPVVVPLAVAAAGSRRVALRLVGARPRAGGRVDVTSLGVNARGRYWNHNSAYHPWILRAATARRASALDVGCGEGLLVQRLATRYDRVVGIDPDPKAVDRARDRAVDLPTVDLFECGLLDYEPAEQFDLVTAIATLHHLDLRAGLQK